MAHSCLELDAKFEPGTYPSGALQLVDQAGGNYLVGGDLVKIGRKADNSIQLKDYQVSRYHTEIQRTTEGLQVVDLGSTNGTYLNGERLTPQLARPLMAGDQIKIGSSLFTLEMVQASE